jgi:hypothetical protein
MPEKERQEYRARYRAGGSPLPSFQGSIIFFSSGVGPDEIELDGVNKVQSRLGRMMPVRILELIRL